MEPYKSDYFGDAEAVLLYQADGRINQRLGSAIGYFAFPLYIHVQILDDDRFIDLTIRLMQEYCNAYEHADSSLVQSQMFGVGCTRNSLFNWIPDGSETCFSGLDQSNGTISCSQYPFVRTVVKNYERDTEPAVAFLEMGDEIQAEVQFSLSRISINEMERFACNLILFMRKLLDPDCLVRKLELS